MSADSSGPAWRLKDLSADEYARLSEVIDACLALPPEARTEWLSRLESKDLRSVAILRRLLATSDASGLGTLLETSEVLTRHLAFVAGGEETLIGKRVGPYRVLSLLGEGGMGSVWLAERADGLFARQVALKLVHPMLMGRQVTERFAREREILASLSHPNIARLFDAGFTQEGQPFLALQYIAGRPITTYCDDRRLTVHERLRLFVQVLSAVQYAHAHLIIHRDLKPSNILVTEEGEVQLLDFGIAKLLRAGDARETELTQLGGRALTPDYAAPEQIAGGSITTASDVYALGVILYELLTGVRPYHLKRDSRGALEEAILAVDPVAPSHVTLSDRVAQVRATSSRKLVRVLRGDLDTIATKALKKSPRERYATANAFGEDVARFLRGDVVLAQRDSVTYRALKFVRRHRLAIAVVSLLTLTLLSGLGATSYEARVASKQRDTARRAQLSLLTQAAAASLRDADLPGAWGIILEVLRPGAANQSYAPDALNVFQTVRASDAQVLAVARHTGPVTFAALSRDGQHLVTASYDKTARVWDARTGREVLELTGHSDHLASAVFSPDGQRILTSSTDGTACIWDVASGRPLLKLNGQGDALRFAAFSPDGTRVVTAVSNTALIWDGATGRRLLELTGHTGEIQAATFSPDGKRVVTAASDGTARIWNATTGRLLLRLDGQGSFLTFAAFSPDGRRVVTASYDRTARIWDAETGQQTRVFAGHTGVVWYAEFSPDGARIATASEDKGARIWDASTGELLMVLNGHSKRVWSASFSPDGRRLVTASYDGTARVWSLEPKHQLTLLQGHSGAVGAAAFSPDGRKVVTASVDGTSRIWDAANGRQLATLLGHSDRVWFATFSPDGRRIGTGSYDKTARIWDSASGKELIVLRGHTGRVTSVAFSSDGSTVITASEDKTARIWSTSTGRQLALLDGQAGRVWFATFSPDGRRVVTAMEDGTARIWDTATGRELLLLRGHTDALDSATFSPDGRYVLTAAEDKTARVWNARTGRQLLVLRGHTEPLSFATFSPDGGRIVTSSIDRTARVWDARTGDLVDVYSGHADRVETASFSPDGRRVVTASDDKTARVWDSRPVALKSEIAWANAAQFDSLPAEERDRMGLPAPPDVRTWRAGRSQCDEVAAAPYDSARRAPGVMLEQIAPDLAVSVCVGNGDSSSETRILYQRGRALMAKGRYSDSRRELEQAFTRGYDAAAIELGRLLSLSSARMLNVERASSLYEQAWKRGNKMAAFELGMLYEHGVLDAVADRGYALAPDVSRAWRWYIDGANAGEPNALARLGEREDAAASAEQSPANSAAHLLQAFRYYADAAERARIEDWPDEAWKGWRYRRASLARVLAAEGLTEEVAAAYEEVVARDTPRSIRPWQRFAASLR